MNITPSGQTLGARIEGIDLGEPLSDADFRTILRALGQHGVLCFPRQTLTTPNSPPSAAASASWRSMSPICSTSPSSPR